MDRTAPPAGLFDPAVLANDPARRGFLLRVLEAAVRAVDPEAAVLATLDQPERGLQEALSRPGDWERIIVLAFGKASVAMARAAEKIFAGHGALDGIAATNTADATLRHVEVIVGGHPTPAAGSVTAAARISELARSAGAGDLVLFLISGGGSAIIELPAGDLTLDDVTTVNDELVRSGASIDEVNTVRKHLSAVKGGRLAEAALPARAVSLVISDVVGNPLDVIASGPTVPDPTTYADALKVLRRFDLLSRLPARAVGHLEQGDAGEIPETPKGGAAFAQHPVVIVADAAFAAAAARNAATGEGVDADIVSTMLTGEARRVGRELADAGRHLGRPGLLIYAGESTVTVSGSGSGGRNQELALAAGITLDGDRDVVVASFGTDGIDGPTDAAGGIGDGATVIRGAETSLHAEDFLARNDSYPYLDSVGDLLRTGPTGTNVGDVMLVHRSG